MGAKIIRAHRCYLGYFDWPLAQPRFLAFGRNENMQWSSTMLLRANFV
jgi:hypothetical protein